jgi:ABC-2 type transport system ATP-binding protein
MQAVIRTTNLTYRYSKHVTVLQDIHLDVKPGSIYGFLGPNGSGKTTTLSLLLGLLNHSAGVIEIFGKDIRTHRVEILRQTGSLIEVPSLYAHLSARENLMVYQKIFSVKKEKVTAVLESVGLAGTGSKLVRQFSLGMKQRLALALALLPGPKLLILDEPTNGLDPEGIHELRDMIKNLNRQEGMTILVSSHILPEVEKLITHVGILARGRLRFQGSLEELRNHQSIQSNVCLITSDNIKAMSVLHNLKTELLNDKISVTLNDVATIAGINRLLVDRGIDVYHLSEQKKDLENLFMTLINQAE